MLFNNLPQNLMTYINNHLFFFNESASGAQLIKDRSLLFYATSTEVTWLGLEWPLLIWLSQQLSSKCWISEVRRCCEPGAKSPLHLDCLSFLTTWKLGPRASISQESEGSRIALYTKPPKSTALLPPKTQILPYWKEDITSSKKILDI